MNFKKDYFILSTLYITFPLGISTSTISLSLCFKIAFPKGDSMDIFFSSGLACCESTIIKPYLLCLLCFYPLL